MDFDATHNLARPEVEFPGAEAPADLVVTDAVIGAGVEATPRSTVLVHYVGTDFETGDEFDASWNRGEPVEFPMRGLIQGWQDGIPCMKVGGRRQLVVPPAQAYGESGGHRLAGRTLVFVIDLLAVR